MIVLVTGDRTYFKKQVIMDTLKWCMLNYDAEDDDVIVHGGANGADTLAGECAKELKINCRPYPANWDKYGKAAGPMRNIEMLDREKPGLVLAFSERLELSKGTKHCVFEANRRGIPVRLYA